MYGRKIKMLNHKMSQIILLFLYPFFLGIKIIERVPLNRMEQKGMHLNHDFYVVVGIQCRTENAYTGHQYNIIYIY